MQERLYTDKTEIMLAYQEGDRWNQISLTYDKMIHVAFEPVMERKFLRKVPGARIAITIAGREDPICIYRSKEKHFDQYLEDMRAFCKRNRVTVSDRLAR